MYLLRGRAASFRTSEDSTDRALSGSLAITSKPCPSGEYPSSPRRCSKGCIEIWSGRYGSPPFGSSLADARSRPHKHTRPMTPWSEGLKPTVCRFEVGLPSRWRQQTCPVCGGVQATSRRRPSSAASRATRSRLRPAHRPEARLSRRLRTARCSTSGPTLAHTDTPRRT
jgi:hypothetical protein